MNKRQLEVQKVNASEEAKTIRQLKRVYSQASKDCEAKIRELSSRTDLENLQSIIFQKQYQDVIKKQIDSVLNDLNTKSFSTITEYLTTSYENGFFGTLYDLQGQGIPLCFPIDQEKVVKAIQTNTKLSKGLYSRLGEDIKRLKKSVKAELSRGIANGESWNQMAGHIANGMNSPFTKAYNNSIRIARTEGHRIQAEATLHCQQKAKLKGADVVKQWDSTLDGATRPSHRNLDGQIKELEEDFEGDGGKAMYPGGFGRASEDCNCRCCLLQRARWALSDEEFTKMNGDTGELVKIQAKSYNEFKDTAKEEIQKQEMSDIRKGLVGANVTYLDVQKLPNSLSSSEIVERIAGGDMTHGSCSSLGFAYIGNKNGLDVMDFRDGESRSFFSQDSNIQKMLQLTNVKGSITKVQKEISGTMELIKNLEHEKEYYLAVGRHTAIIKNTEKGAEYLELQSSLENGWTSFEDNRYGSMYNTLNKRFGCRKTVDKLKVGETSMIFEKEVVLMDVDSFKDNEEFRKILGYINTSVGEQKKGVKGNVK